MGEEQRVSNIYSRVSNTWTRLSILRAVWEGGASGPPGLAATGTTSAPEKAVDSRVFDILFVIFCGTTRRQLPNMLLCL